MPWAAVKSLRSDTALNVVLPSGETVKGSVATSGDQLQVTAPGAPKTAPLATVTAVRNDAEQHQYERLQNPGLLDLWAGYFDVGFALATGNSRSQLLTTAFNAARVTRTDKLSAYFNQVNTKSRVNNVTSTTASALRGGWKYNRTLVGRLFATGFNDYEHDRFQNLDLRFVAGGGLGMNLIKTERTQLDVDAGINYQRENFMNGTTRNSLEANFGDNLAYKMNKAVSLTQSARFFANLTNTGEYRMNFDFGTNTVLKSWLGWHVTASDRFVSNPLPGRQRNDLLLSTGLRLSFAR
jgi:putative salt-induced outer membrane protein YdiY